MDIRNAAWQDYCWQYFIVYLKLAKKVPLKGSYHIHTQTQTQEHTHTHTHTHNLRLLYEVIGYGNKLDCNNHFKFDIGIKTSSCSYEHV